ncbi:MAG: formylmethanofuran dehydrogenase subunit C [Anaerolineales bacterium]|nr:formylmethanofuran dehydrogenase subunit C [Anaerolineales bacterium]
MTLTLRLHTKPEAPVEAACLRPDRLATLSREAIGALPLLHGNRPASVDDFFDVSGEPGPEVTLDGDLRAFKWLGHEMAGGTLRVTGAVGRHAGAGMTGGRLEVAGDADDWAGAEMAGGRLVIHGNAGQALGGGYVGSRQGMTGGEIIVHGRAGDEAGRAMRRGLIAIGGDCGDFAGAGMLAGTLVVLGQLGGRAAAGMRRGTLVSLRPARLLPTFRFACVYRPTFLRLYLRYLRDLGLPLTEGQVAGAYARYSGDHLELGRGEILLWEGV